MNIHEDPALRDRQHVFRDRAAAGRALAEMLADYRASDAVVVAIPAGGVPVAIEIACALALPLEPLPVSKVLFPWTTEAGFGAVAFDGTTWIDDGRAHDLSEAEIQRAVDDALAKVTRRLARLRADRALPSFEGHTAMVVDDGIAAGSTLRAALSALARLTPDRTVVAVPTGHASSVARVAEVADEVWCANVRGGLQYAVADAYERWHDVSDDEVLEMLAASR